MMTASMPFELQPVLEGRLVRLRPLRPDDWSMLYAVASDPLIWEQHPEPERFQEPVFRQFFAGALDSGGAFLVSDAASGQPIGSTRFAHYDEAAGEVEIGWTFLARSHWGGPCNREMKHLMLRHAFQFVRTVVFRIGPQNLRSRRAVEKLGAVEVRSEVDADGRRHVVYRIGPEALLP
jgi:RimJ/RimL family protein N-acetyltransferase